MGIPTVKFRKMTLPENIEVIKWVYFEDNGSLEVHDYVVEYFPELKNIDEKMSRDEIYKLIEKVVTNDYYTYNEKIKSDTERYNAIWKEYDDKYLNELTNYFKVDWPRNIETIEGTVGLIPVFPRYLDSFSFSVGTGIESEKLIKTVAHEVLHFMWFEKWKQIHPETPRREYDSPYLVWQYSEMVTDPILNNQPFANILRTVERSYDSFYEIYDGSDLVMDNLRKMYSKEIPIDEKIEMGFNYVKNIIERDKNPSK